MPSKILIPTLFSFVLVLFGCSTETKKKTVLPEKQETKSETTQVEATNETAYQVQITPFEQVVKAIQSGKIEKVIESKRVFKGALLVQFDNSEAFNTLIRLKKELKELILLQFIKVPTEIQSESDKWRRYSDQISETDLLPATPEIKFKEEFLFLKSFGFFEKQLEIQQVELGMKNYFLFSPQSGMFKPKNLSTGQYIKKGETIGIIAKKNCYTITIQSDTDLSPKEWTNYYTTHVQLNDTIRLVKIDKIKNPREAQLIGERIIR